MYPVGVKLAGAFDHFSELDATGVVAIDVGASTGGFTDVLLRRGAQKVYAVDVGHGQLTGRYGMMNAWWYWKEPMPDI